MRHFIKSCFLSFLFYYIINELGVCRWLENSCLLIIHWILKFEEQFGGMDININTFKIEYTVLLVHIFLSSVSPVVLFFFPRRAISDLLIKYGLLAEPSFRSKSSRKQRKIWNRIMSAQDLSLSLNYSLLMNNDNVLHLLRPIQSQHGALWLQMLLLMLHILFAGESS